MVRKFFPFGKKSLQKFAEMGLTSGTNLPMLIGLDMKNAAHSPRAVVSKLFIQIADETRNTT